VREEDGSDGGVRFDGGGCEPQPHRGGGYMAEDQPAIALVTSAGRYAFAISNSPLWNTVTRRSSVR
jgi:hypothetical protein